MERYTRVFSFMFEVFAMIGKNKTLLKPMLYNLAIAAPLNLLLAIAYSQSSSSAVQFIIMAVGVTALYFTDYFCNALTVSLVYDQVTTGEASMEKAIANTKRSAPGILTFAAISGVFDLLQSYANERDDVLGKILTRVLYMVWTAATYVVMPAMVIEGLSFGEAFARSKQTAERDPTQVGAGIIGIGMVNWLLGAVCVAVAYNGAGLLGRIHPIVGGLFFFSAINLYWAVSGYLKITYFTCFYMWARECEKAGHMDPKLAPAPLANALGNAVHA